MRLGLSHTLSHKSPEDFAERNVSLGLGTVNFPINSSASDKDIFAYEKAVKDAGLTIAEVGVWTNPVAKDEAERKKNLEYCINQLKMADAIGARCCVNVAGAVAGKRWDGGCKENFSEDAFKMTVESVQTIIDAVNPKNTVYSLEPMPWMIPTGPDEYLKLIEAINRDAFAVHMDIVNMINCPDRYFFSDDFLDDCFTKLAGRIKSCHIKDVNLLEHFTFQLLECECGAGTLNLEKYADLANKEDKDMPMIIEHLESEQQYLDSLVYVKKRLADYIS